MVDEEKDVVVDDETGEESETGVEENMALGEDFEDLEDVEFSELSQIEDEIREIHQSGEIVPPEQWEEMLERVENAKPTPVRGLIPIQSKRKMRQLERRFDKAIEDGNETVQDRIADSMIFKEDMETWKSLKTFCQFMSSTASKSSKSMDISYTVEEG